MLVTFKCKAHGNVTMFGDVAKRFLKMMGHSGTIPSALYAEDVPAALERLKKAVNLEQEKQSDDMVYDIEEDELNEPPVSLAVRAFPLMEMLSAAAEESCNVMWYKE